ncbi:MAG: phosphate ABC transporter substrate-binding protein PstS [Candidatus Nezhaarchaeota archaeon]|nr:phosphate ABC transporter substrate-binding protein PstS [Candidatus Nezhaarchaeota archaeon]
MKTVYKIAILAVMVTVVAASIFAYQYMPEAQEAQEVSLNGAGATFPFPLIDKWAAEYHKLRPNVKINYQPIGSGGGIKQHIEKTVHFAASDVPLTEAQAKNAPNTLHIPITIGGVVPIYNIPGMQSGLRFTGEVLADIYLGKIKKWNDPRLIEINPGVNLPDNEIVVVHRSDGSGTTFIWTSYLSNISPEWRSRVGKGTSVKWPVGIGGKGNEGVATLVMQTPYSIGYVEFTYAKKNNLAYGYVKNAAGEFVEPSITSFAKAAEYAGLTLPRGDGDWSKVSMVDSLFNNTRARGAYPITSFSYLLVYRELSVLPNMDEAAARALVEFLWWIIHDGQGYAPGLYYVPLPQNVVNINEDTIRLITYNGKQLYRR